VSKNIGFSDYGDAKISVQATKPRLVHCLRSVT